MILISRYENNPEALSETITKIHDIKKAFVKKFHRGIRRYYPKHRWSGLFYLITLMYNIVILFLSKAVLFRSLSFSLCLSLKVTSATKG